jgi:hypothetical protein
MKPECSDEDSGTAILDAVGCILAEDFRLKNQE